MAVIGVLLIRLWFMQVIDAQGYAAAAVANSIRTVVVPAPRGLITDRTGKTILADNIPSVNVVAFPLELQGAQRATEMAMLAPILHTGADQLTAAMVSGQAASPYLPVVVGENISVIQQAVISEHARQFPGVELQSAYLRNYPFGTLAAHILGYTGTITPQEYPSYVAQGYLGNEQVGQAGIDAQYEQYLRGISGQTQVEVDASGNPVSARPVSSTPPVQGDNLALSIDMATQTALENQLRLRVAASRTATGAAGVAIDPNSGQILAMASYPTYSPNAFVQRTPANNNLITRYLTNGRSPLLNRAIGASYPPGSSFKPVTSISALELGILSPTELISGPPQITLFGTVFPNFGFENNGSITLPTALEVSSDTYFYQVGARFWNLHEASVNVTNNPNSGLQQQDWAQKFGFNSPTGIDLPGEVPGLVPTPAWTKAHFSQVDPAQALWNPGDNINMAVGQGNLLVTPLQMAVAYSAIANGGSLVTPTLGLDVTNQSGQVVRQLADVTPPRSMGLSPAVLDVVRQGLYLVAQGPQGLAAGVFSPVAAAGGPVVAGKTGTAQSGAHNQADHAWFVGYAPFANPKIVVAVVVEHGGYGASAAAPAVCATIAAYGPTKFNPHLCGGPALGPSN